MAEKITKIAALAPFAAGMGRQPGRFARVSHDLIPALEVFGRSCVIEAPRTLVAKGRVSVPLVPPDGLTAATWFPPLWQSCQEHADGERMAPSTPAPSASIPAAASPLDDLLDMVALPEQSSSPTSASRVADQSPETALLNHILQHPDYQARGAAWQGLSWVHALAGGAVQWLLVDIDATNFPDESQQLEELLLAEEPELLIADLALTNTPRDQKTLATLAEIGDQLLAPVLCWLASPFWGIRTWEEIDRLAYLPTLLDLPQYGKWRALCHRGEARLLWTGVGRVALVQEPEQALPPHTAAHLWLSPVWALTALIINQQKATGLPYPLAGARIAPPTATTFALQARFDEDRCLQFLDAHQAPLIGSTNAITFAGLPLADGSSLDLQLLLRSLLGWLFSLDPGQYGAEELQANLVSLWQTAGIQPPAAIEFTVEQGNLFLSIRRIAGLSSAGGEITLQLPWNDIQSSESGKRG